MIYCPTHLELRATRFITDWERIPSRRWLLVHGCGVGHTRAMDAAFSTRAPSLRWPGALVRRGVTPAVAGIWALHEAVVGLAVDVPLPHGPGSRVDGLAWFRWDVPFYQAIARIGYGRLPSFYSAYFPGVPAYLWLTHWPIVALVVVQGVFLALLIQVGRLAAAWGLAERRVWLALALVALTPAAVFYGTAYPEAWEALGLCSALLAMKAGRPWRAAAWSLLAGVMDPLGMLVGVGAAAWSALAAMRRDWAGLREGLIWALGSVTALAAVSETLAANGRPPLAFIGAQRAWGAHWVVPGVQIWQALTVPLGPESTTRIEALAILPVFLVGAVALARVRPSTPWRTSAAAIGIALFGVALAFYTNREPLSSTARFLSLDVPAVIALAGVLPRRLASSTTIWSGLWALAGAILFTHGWFWG